MAWALPTNWSAFFAPNGNGMMLLMMILGLLIVYLLAEHRADHG